MEDYAIVFDFDGVILDTETPLYRSWQEVYASHGLVLELTLFARYIGGAEYFDFHAHLEELTGLHIDRETLMSDRRARYREIVSADAVLPGVREYLSAARRLSCRVGLASNSDIGWVGTNLEELRLTEWFDVVKTRDDVMNVKPDPEIYLEVLRALGTEPRRAIAIEDSVSGVAAAKAAGLFTVAVPNPVTRSHNLDAADLLLNRLDDMSIERLLELAGERHGSAPLNRDGE